MAHKAHIRFWHFVKFSWQFASTIRLYFLRRRYNLWKWGESLSRKYKWLWLECRTWSFSVESYALTIKALRLSIKTETISGSGTSSSFPDSLPVQFDFIFLGGDIIYESEEKVFLGNTSDCGWSAEPDHLVWSPTRSPSRHYVSQSRRKPWNDL